jgi:hypothetical protein
MKKRHEVTRKPPKRKVAEPVQVYLEPPDRERLERLATRLDATKSDVLRRGLTALESQTRPPRTKGSVTPAPLPTFRGRGLQPGVDLDDTASLLDLMDRRDAAR